MTLGGNLRPCNNNSKLMDIMRELPLYLQNFKGPREYKNQVITKNTLQEIAESLKAEHGKNLNKCLSICLPDANGAAKLVTFP